MSDYILFAGSHYYPNGGASDIKGTFNSIDEAKNYLSSSEFLIGYRTFYEDEDLWGQIYNLKTLRVVAEYCHDDGWL